jgi:preprotein translocase subunit YajC
MGGVSMVCNAGSGSSSKCFPGAATVELEGGATKTMAELAVGDRVLAAPGVYSPVYLFSHRLSAVKTGFVTIEAGNAAPLQLTPDHYLYVNGVLTTAATVAVGDEVTLRDGTNAAVTKVHTTWAQGLYNPHTMHGDLDVHGVQTSTYTQGIAPALAHAALLPVRMLYAAGVAIADETTFAEGSDLLAAVLPNGKAKY